MTSPPRQTYMIGGGIGSLAAAAFLIREAGMPGKWVTVFEALPRIGGSLDGEGTAAAGYVMGGGRGRDDEP